MAAVASIAGGVAAHGLLGFRLLDLDGAGVRWGDQQGSIPVVTYAIVDRDLRFPDARNCGGVRQIDDLLQRSAIDRGVFEDEVRAAFDMWSQATNIEFRPAEDVASAGILIGAQIEPVGHAFANVAYRPGAGPVRTIERSLICLNPLMRWKVGFDGSLDVYDLRYTIAHEIGHAIGLDHPDASSQLMSFSYRESFRDLQPGDIEGAERLYGRREHPSHAAQVAPASLSSAGAP